MLFLIKKPSRASANFARRSASDWRSGTSAMKQRPMRFVATSSMGCYFKVEACGFWSDDDFHVELTEGRWMGDVFLQKESQPLVLGRQNELGSILMVST